jgi:hypothetical protein
MCQVSQEDNHGQGNNLEHIRLSDRDAYMLNEDENQVRTTADKGQKKQCLEE